MRPTALEVAVAGDADDECGEDQRSDDALDEAQEDVGEDAHLHGEMRCVEAELRAGDHGDEHPDGEAAAEGGEREQRGDPDAAQRERDGVRRVQRGGDDAGGEADDAGDEAGRGGFERGRAARAGLSCGSASALCGKDINLRAGCGARGCVYDSSHSVNLIREMPVRLRLAFLSFAACPCFRCPRLRPILIRTFCSSLRSART